MRSDAPLLLPILRSQHQADLLTRGGHYAVEIAVREQFSGKFSQFGALRRQRNDIEYPRIITAPLTKADADSAIGLAQELTEAALQLLPHLSLFG